MYCAHVHERLIRVKSRPGSPATWCPLCATCGRCADWAKARCGPVV